MAFLSDVGRSERESNGLGQERIAGVEPPDERIGYRRWVHPDRVTDPVAPLSVHVSSPSQDLLRSEIEPAAVGDDGSLVGNDRVVLAQERVARAGVPVTIEIPEELDVVDPRIVGDARGPQRNIIATYDGARCNRQRTNGRRLVGVGQNRDFAQDPIPPSAVGKANPSEEPVLPGRESRRVHVPGGRSAGDVGVSQNRITGVDLPVSVEVADKLNEVGAALVGHGRGER